MTVKTEDSITDSIEAKYAKRLAANEKKTREKAFNELRSYFVKKSMEPEGGFLRDELLRLWKGLFYCLWMSDKPLVQEELARNIAEILPALQSSKTSTLFCETFLTTMEREWHGIDKLRMDKFYLLIRFMLQQIFVLLKNNAWDNDLMDWFDRFMKNGPASPWSQNPSFSSGSPIGLRLHFMDIYIEELTEFGHNLLKPEQVTQFLQPYCHLICETKVLPLRRRARSTIFQEIIDQSDAVMEAVAGVAEIRDLKRLQIDYSAISSSLLMIMHEKKVCRPNRDYVTKLITKLKTVAEGHIPLNMVPDFGGENLNNNSKFKQAENDLVERLCEEMESDYRKSRQERKEYHKDVKKQKKNVNDLPFQSSDLHKDVDFDRIANMRADDEDDNMSYGEKMKQKRKNKSKKNKASLNEVENHTSCQESTPLSVKEMMKDFVVTPNKKEKIMNVSTEIKSRKRKSKVHIENSEKVNDEDDVSTSIAKKRRVGVVQPLSPDDINVLSNFAKKKVSKRVKRQKNKKILLNKLLEGENEEAVSKSNKTAANVEDSASKNVSIKKVIKASESQTESANANGDAKTKKLAQILGTDLAQAAIVKEAMENSKKVKPTKPKIEDFTKSVSTPKRVSFEMSKTQVQRFRKFDKASVVSSSPSTVAFDPNRTPDFGLLKNRKLAQKKTAAKKRRMRASDFFE